MFPTKRIGAATEDVQSIPAGLDRLHVGNGVKLKLVGGEFMTPMGDDPSQRFLTVRDGQDFRGAFFGASEPPARKDSSSEIASTLVDYLTPCCR